MKLLLSALLLAAVPFAFGQEYEPQNQFQNQGVATMEPAQSGAALTPQQKNALEMAQAKARAAMQATIDHMAQTGCPLYLESASVAPGAGYLPVTATNRQDGALDLRFRNQSGKAITSASITAQVNVKTNVYDLDAHALELRLTLAGTQDLDKTLDQMQHIALPRHVYLFGVARVTLDRVTYADGSVWTAPASNVCRTSGAMGPERIAK
ncbi:MAG: hypothetical protein WBW84_09145 [Acidobacteriaceae bacterium]